MTRGLLWSPHVDDQFLVTNPGLRLFSLRRQRCRARLSLSESETARQQRDPEPSASELDASDAAVQVVGSNTDEIVWQNTCVAWFPRATPHNLLAAAQPSGTVSLVGVLQDRAPEGFVRKDLVPRVSRKCVAVAWNPVFHEQLAVGLDKNNREASLLVWDVNTTIVSLVDTKKRQAGVLHDVPSGGARWRVAGARQTSSTATTTGARTNGPFEFASAEGVVSLAWLPDLPNLVVAGIGSKWLKLFDTRASVTASSSTMSARGAHHVSVDPCNNNIVGLFSPTEHCIKIYDIRQFAEPLFAIPDCRHVEQLSWCPTRPGLLGALSRHSHVVRLFDTHLTHGDKFDATAGAFIRQKLSRPIELEGGRGRGPDPLSAFSWHPKDVNRLLTLSTAGVIEDLWVSECMPTTCSPRGELVFGNVDTVVASDLSMALAAGGADAGNSNSAPQLDVAAVMHRRALAGYGLEIPKNIELTADDPQLQDTWVWLAQQSAAAYGVGFIGVRNALQLDAKMMQRSVPEANASVRFDQGVIFPVYDTTSQREAAIRLCGWATLANPQALDSMLTSLEQRGEYERAATLALFHQNIRRSIQSLTRGADHVEEPHRSVLVATAMALSGYTPNLDLSLWRDTCGSLRSRLLSPYLRAALAFLTSTDTYYHDVLEESGMRLADRVSFACRFLEDETLNAYLDRISVEVVSAGKLSGLLLTGFNAEGVDLLHQYVDRTADVQTVSALCSVAMLHLTGPALRRVQADPRVIEWVESYRDLLDIWQLWILRARFDVSRLAASPSKVPQQVYMRCNFCNNRVTGSATARGGFQRGMLGSPMHQTNTRACPTCRKPLPRCSVCLVRMGSALGQPSGEAEENQLVAKPLDNWVTWCQDCRHGGHASHLEAWFRHHDECPVAGCSCLCNSGRSRP